MDRIDKRKTPVGSSAAVRSWVAGVLDAGLRVVASRTYHPRAAQLQVYLRADEEVLREVRDVLDARGTIRKQGSSYVLAFTMEEAYELYNDVAPVMRSAAREWLRVAAAWSALSPGKGRSSGMSDETVEQRGRLLDELSGLKAEAGVDVDEDGAAAAEEEE